MVCDTTHYRWGPLTAKERVSSLLDKTGRANCSRPHGFPSSSPGLVPTRLSSSSVQVEYRTLNVRHWDLIVEAWAANDDQALDDAWIDQIVDLGSQWGQYHRASACPRLAATDFPLPDSVIE